jgi:transcriptional regulator with PAS, ATPase and Fis domain
MKKKRITILAIDKQVSEFFKRELNKIFGNIFEIDYRHLEMNPVPVIYSTDLILYTDPEMLNNLISVIKCDAPTLMMKRTITREALTEIREIPPGETVLVANINQFMANETMALIYQLGITDIQLVPYYEGKEELTDNVGYIIVPEKEPYDFLPDIEAEILLTGNRVFDISNVLDILSFMQVDNEQTEEIIKKYLLKVPTFWYGFEYAWQNRRVLLNQWKLLLDELTSGVIVTDSVNKIELVNDKLREILNLEGEIGGRSLEGLVKNRQNLGFILADEEKSEELVRYQGKELVLTVRMVQLNGQSYGKIIIIKPYNEMVMVQQKIHKKIVGEGHSSKYQFSDLKGRSSSFNQAKEIAKKISRSDSTVLLLGESGTGKEMFAGAIHNFSHRANQPFVAINCATLPDNLLESELFGYEEGAFTGAKKGGKIGLFEQADGGTIFLDEIGDLPLQLQARLLRALEEKEIMRVGGKSIIKVNVRVIAATNRNLMKLVEQGSFRKDLFYRLNVFQIELPSLNERKDDIPYLIEHFLNKWDIKRSICRDFEVFFNNYSWPGNVRELRNVLEYITTISKGKLSFTTVPTYLKDKDYYINDDYNGKYLLLKILNYRCQDNKSTGRRSLTKVFNKLYYKVSEMEVRDLIKELEDENYLEINQGRAGNSITEEGIQVLQNQGFMEEKNKKYFIE